MMRDEFTPEMHKEFSVSPYEERRMKAFCVWDLLDWDASREEITKMAKMYGITYGQAMRWKEYWMKLIRKSPEDYELDKCESILNAVYENYREERDSLRNEYNIFSSIGIEADENKHSALLASLLLDLDQERKVVRSCQLLQLFLDQMQELSALGIEPSFASVSTEARIGSKTESEGGRIDILISTSDRAVIIENKIYAQDQENQIERYHNYAVKYYPKGFVILYLTLDGHQPSTYSCGDLVSGKDYYCISYKSFILKWLQRSLDVVTVNNPYLYFTIKQYISIIKKLTMREEFINILCDKSHAKNLSILLDNKNQLEKRIIDKYLLDAIHSMFAKKGTEWEVCLKPQFYNNIKIAYRPKYWAQLGIWHVVQIISGGCFYGLCVDGNEVKRGFYPQSPLRILQNGSNDAFPFGWINIPFSMELVVDGSTAYTIAKFSWQVMTELADEQRKDFGYFNRDSVQTIIDKCEWKLSSDGSHEYISRDNCGLSSNEFEQLIKNQRFMGVELTWEGDGRDYIYLFLNGYKYWTMGNPIEETTIINRTRHTLKK